MLEERIIQLNSTIIELCARLDRLWDAGQAQRAQQKEPEPAAKQPLPAEAQDLISEIQELCLSLVRKDKSHKKTVKEIINKFGGELVKDVSEDKLPELKAALEAL